LNCFILENFTFRLRDESLPRSHDGHQSKGRLQVYHNGRWGDVVYYNISDDGELKRMLVSTASGTSSHHNL